MRLTFAIALILAELGVGILLLLPLVPAGEVRKSFFAFHSIVGALCFALAAGVHQFELQSQYAPLGLWGAMAVCMASFGTSQRAKPACTRSLHLIAACLGAVFGLFGPIGSLASRIESIPGAPAVPALLVVLWGVGALLGAVLLGSAHDAMALGHWYLISRNLSFRYLVRSAKGLMVVLALRAVFLVTLLAILPHIAPAYSRQFLPDLFSSYGKLVFFLMRVVWGLLLPSLLAVMSWRCALGKANQAATGLLYLCEVSVLFGELFAAYLLI